MSVGLLLVTHADIGRTLLDTATRLLGNCPLEVQHLSVPLDCNPDAMEQQARQYIRQLDQGSGVLIVTDIFGATPGNIAARFREQPGIRILTGLNLPMLVRIFNYPTLDLDQLAEKALGGGKDGVINLDQTPG